MIVLDIETTGLNPEKHGIWQIAALDFYNPKEYFFNECRIDDEDEVTEGAIAVHGKSEEYVRDTGKQSQKELLEALFDWIRKKPISNCACQNPHFDLGFIHSKARKYELECPIPHRSFDLHTVAAIRFYDLNKRFLLNDKKSDMNLTNIMKFCGLEDKRTDHNALEDVLMTAECLSRLIDGKCLIETYKEFKVPDYLVKT